MDMLWWSEVQGPKWKFKRQNYVFRLQNAIDRHSKIFKLGTFSCIWGIEKSLVTKLTQCYTHVYLNHTQTELPNFTNNQCNSLYSYKNFYGEKKWLSCIKGSVHKLWLSCDTRCIFMSFIIIIYKQILTFISHSQIQSSDNFGTWTSPSIFCNKGWLMITSFRRFGNRLSPIIFGYPRKKISTKSTWFEWSPLLVILL